MSLDQIDELMAGGPVLLAFLVSALAGLVSFASPCVVPLVPGYLSYLAAVVGVGADTAKLVGSASVEGEAQDGITNERLAAVVDSRAGTKGVTRMLSKWADVEAICDYWGERVTEFFVSRGVRQKT